MKKGLLLALAVCSSYVASAQNVFGALAIDRSNGFYYGFSSDYATLSGAQSRALKECTAKGGSCTIVLSWQGKSCAAYRTIPGNAGTAYGWGLASTREAADAIATSEAQKRSNGVFPSNYAWACNSVGEFKEIKPDAGTSASSAPSAASPVTSSTAGAKIKALKGLKDKDGDIYDYLGEVLNDAPYGKGTATYVKNGSVVTGDFRNGFMNGKGTIRWPSGASYEGEFVDNKMQGQGVYKFATGTVYRGGFANSKMHGFGEWIAPEGNSYKGYFKDNKFHGAGTLTAGPNEELINTPKAVKYVGEFVNGDRVGQGQCYDKNGKLLYSGNFSNDKPTGTYPN